MTRKIDPDVPRERQTIRLPRSKLAAFREWAVWGTALTAAARVCDRAGRIALVKNGWSDGWILPGGAVESDESPEATARREVREETGLDATIGDPILAIEQTYCDRDGVERFEARYLVYDAAAEGEIPDADRLGVTDDEIRAARWFDTPPENLHDGDLLRAYL